MDGDVKISASNTIWNRGLEKTNLIRPKIVPWKEEEHKVSWLFAMHLGKSCAEKLSNAGPKLVFAAKFCFQRIYVVIEDYFLIGAHPRLWRSGLGPASAQCGNPNPHSLSMPGVAPHG